MMLTLKNLKSLQSAIRCLYDFTANHDQDEVLNVQMEELTKYPFGSYFIKKDNEEKKDFLDSLEAYKELTKLINEIEHGVKTDLMFATYLQIPIKIRESEVYGSENEF